MYHYIFKLKSNIYFLCIYDIFDKNMNSSDEIKGFLVDNALICTPLATYIYGTGNGLR